MERWRDTISHCISRTVRNVFKLKEGRFGLNTRKKFISVGVVRHWNSSSRAVEVLKASLDGA